MGFYIPWVRISVLLLLALLTAGVWSTKADAATSAWSEPVTVASFTGWRGDYPSPIAATGADGTTAVTWIQRTVVATPDGPDERVAVMAAVVTAAGVARSPVELDATLNSQYWATGYHAHTTSPAVAVGPNGDVAVAWQGMTYTPPSAGGSDCDCRYSLKVARVSGTTGTLQGSPLVVAEDAYVPDSRGPDSPPIAVGADATAYLAWVGYIAPGGPGTSGGPNGAVMLSRVAPNGKVSSAVVEPAPISETPGHNQVGLLGVRALADGDVGVAATRSDPSQVGFWRIRETNMTRLLQAPGAHSFIGGDGSLLATGFRMAPDGAIANLGATRAGLADVDATGRACYIENSLSSSDATVHRLGSDGSARPSVTVTRQDLGVGYALAVSVVQLNDGACAFLSRTLTGNSSADPPGVSATVIEAGGAVTTTRLIDPQERAGGEYLGPSSRAIGVSRNGVITAVWGDGPTIRLARATHTAGPLVPTTPPVSGPRDNPPATTNPELCGRGVTDPTLLCTTLGPVAGQPYTPVAPGTAKDCAKRYPGTGSQSVSDGLFTGTLYGREMSLYFVCVGALNQQPVEIDKTTYCALITQTVGLVDKSGASTAAGIQCDALAAADNYPQLSAETVCSFLATGIGLVPLPQTKAVSIVGGYSCTLAPIVIDGVANSITQNVRDQIERQGKCLKIGSSNLFGTTEVSAAKCPSGIRQAAVRTTSRAAIPTRTFKRRPLRISAPRSARVGGTIKVGVTTRAKTRVVVYVARAAQPWPGGRLSLYSRVRHVKTANAKSRVGVVLGRSYRLWDPKRTKAISRRWPKTARADLLVCTADPGTMTTCRRLFIAIRR